MIDLKECGREQDEVLKWLCFGGLKECVLVTGDQVCEESKACCKKGSPASLRREWLQ